MKKHWKWIVPLALACAAAVLWRSYATDPLADYKKAQIEVLENQVELKALVEEALKAIEANDKHALYKLVGGDPMAFNRRYIQRMFHVQDFCPAEMGQSRKITRNDEIFYQVDVHSVKRKRDYQFNIARNRGQLVIASIEER
ncbi:MAG: hypothetical protein IJJ33_20785 [Victivallales bacterium]|nr:hypothetical protein [Victivallales bacterium]